MDKTRKPYRYWDYERCYEEAKKYKSSGEFQKNCGSAYTTARNKGWMVDYTWFEPPKNLIKWTRETCYEEAKKYKSSGEFWKRSQSAYAVALRKGWMVDYTWFEPSKNLKKWTRESCYNEAKKFKSQVEFRNNAGRAYNVAKRNKWLKDYTWFEKGVISDKSIYVVYCYKDDETKSVYVGLANNLRRRHREHCKGFVKHGERRYDVVYKYFHSIGKDIPDPIILKENLFANEAQFYEGYYVDVYNDEGMNVLNLANTGSLGGYGQWTREMCYEEARKYTSRWDFGNNNGSAYQAARRNGWLEDYTWFSSPLKAWTSETCYEEARKYKSRKEFSNKASGAYGVARKNGWLNEYIWLSTPQRKKKWTREACYDEAKKYNSRWEFGKNSSGAYQVARDNGWLEDYIWFEKKWDKWNRETCFTEAKKYESRSAFSKNSSGAYAVARDNGWLDDYTWFKQKCYPSGYWTHEMCYNEAKKYSSRGEFQKQNKKAYMASYKHGWLDEFFPK